MTNVGCHICHLCQKCQKCRNWRICHLTYVIFEFWIDFFLKDRYPFIPYHIYHVQSSSLWYNLLMSYLEEHPVYWPNMKQAGAVMGQAQLKLGLDVTSINMHWIDEQDILLVRLTTAISMIPVQLTLNLPTRSQPAEVSHDSLASMSKPPPIDPQPPQNSH